MLHQAGSIHLHGAADGAVQAGQLSRRNPKDWRPSRVLLVSLREGNSRPSACVVSQRWVY